MVSLNTIHTSNTLISTSFPPLTALFIGATSGIGLIALKKFTKYTIRPRAYFVGRSQEAADRIVADLKAINAGGEYTFLKADVSLMRVVDEVCERIREKEGALNLLFLSAGVPSMDRSVTSENLHLLASLNYYSRLRFISNLLPLLQQAASLRRVVTVAGGGKEGPLDTTDFPALHIPVQNFRGHLSTLITLGLEAVSQTQAPIQTQPLTSKDPKEEAEQQKVKGKVSFVHAYPGTVDTPLLNYLPRDMYEGLTFVPIEECGERMLFLSTSAMYPPPSHAGDWTELGEGVVIGEGESVATGTNGEVGSGVYSIGQDCESAGEDVRVLLKGLREKGVVESVWRHTVGEWERITGVGIV